jgi:hypothetical protein
MRSIKALKFIFVFIGVLSIMCTLRDEKITKQFIKDNPDYVYAYKVLIQDNDCLTSCFIKNYKWKCGENTSDIPKYVEETHINIAIHVCLKLDTAVSWASSIKYYHANSNLRIVKVKCYTEDLLGVEHPSLGAAAYTKVYLDEEEYSNAMKGDLCAC